MSDRMELDEESDLSEAEEEGEIDDTQRDWTTAFFRSLNSFRHKWLIVT